MISRLISAKACWMIWFAVPLTFPNSCDQADSQETMVLPDNVSEYRTVSDIPAPGGYTRVQYEEQSYSHWISHLSLKPEKRILTYQGDELHNPFYAVWAVLDRPLLFDQDLEQCADYAMRLWADYHKETGTLYDLYLFDYSGNRQYFRPADISYELFLRRAFNYSNSHSLKQGCITVTPDNLRPGDLIVQNESGGIGHVSVIMNICASPQGDSLYLIGYSFMPAQEFHIEQADAKYGSDGWFTLEGYYTYLADHLDLGKPVLRRFE